jgi:Ankyrin repeats (3 copies)
MARRTSLAFALLVVLINFVLVCWLYETIGWHDLRGYREVTNGLVALPIICLAAVNLSLGFGIAVRQHSFLKNSFLPLVMVISAFAVASSVLIVPPIGRLLNRHLLLPTPLIEAARYQDAALVLEKLKHGEHPNVRHKVLAITPLHCMAATGQSNVVELLLKKGADPNAKDQGKKTPLHWAVFSAADIRTIQLLVRHGADPKLPDFEGRTPISMTNGMPEPKCSQILAIFGTQPIGQVPQTAIP